MTLPNYHLWEKLKKESEIGDNIAKISQLELVRQEIEQGIRCPVCLCEKYRLKAEKRVCCDCGTQFNSHTTRRKEDVK